MTLVAIRTFTDPTDGGRITAGQSFVDESADVVKLFPDRFRPCAGRKARASKRRSTSRPNRERPAWLLGEPTTWRL